MYVFLSPHLRTETNSVSETLCFLISRIRDDEQIPKTQEFLSIAVCTPCLLLYKIMHTSHRPLLLLFLPLFQFPVLIQAVTPLHMRRRCVPEERCKRVNQQLISVRNEEVFSARANQLQKVTDM
jgi:hypothetical protein